MQFITDNVSLGYDRLAADGFPLDQCAAVKFIDALESTVDVLV